MLIEFINVTNNEMYDFQRKEWDEYLYLLLLLRRLLCFISTNVVAHYAISKTSLMVDHYQVVT
jgi:hypothetical protein